MPHIRALFVEDESIMALLREKKAVIRQAVAVLTDYSLEEIAFIPEMIPATLADLADNLLPLEFIIDGGTKCLDNEKFIGYQLKLTLTEGGGQFSKIHFGIWVRSMAHNHFEEYKPT